MYELQKEHSRLFLRQITNALLTEPFAEINLEIDCVCQKTRFCVV